MDRVIDFTFHTDLHLVRYRDGLNPPPSGNYEKVSVKTLLFLEKDYIVSFILDGEPIRYTVLSGMSTDFASIPDFVPKWIAKKVDAHIEAAIVHDHMCQAETFNYKTAADVFYAAMIAGGTPKWRAKAMRLAVVLGGPKWGDPEKPTVY